MQSKALCSQFIPTILSTIKFTDAFSPVIRFQKRAVHRLFQTLSPLEGAPFGASVEQSSHLNKNKDLKVAICGGGIGGMTLALSLVDAGFHDIDVYESVPEIKEIGVGINIQPNAIRELVELGLGDDLAKTGIPTEEIVYFHKNGQFIYKDPRGIAAGYHWPQYSILRGKLLGILHRAVVERLGEERIHVGHKVVNCGSCEAGGWAQFEIRGQQEYEYSKRRRIEADLIVGCDGVYSNVRKVLAGKESPRYMGITMLRGLTRMKPFLGGRTMTIIGPIENEMVIYPVSKEADDEGYSLVNWVALKRMNEKEMDMVHKDQWNVEVQNLDQEIMPFMDFKYDFIDVPSMIQAASDKVYKYPMIDRPPLDTWVYGNVTLLGDAAHPMIPIGSNGATQTIIDGRVLALELARQENLATALDAYNDKRREVVNQIVRANREESDTRFLEIIHEAFPRVGKTEYNFEEIVTQQELDIISKKYKLLAGFDPKTLNKRESYSFDKNPTAKEVFGACPDE